MTCSNKDYTFYPGERFHNEKETVSHGPALAKDVPPERYPDFRKLEMRVDSFRGKWPIRTKPSPNDLAKAGFFFKHSEKADDSVQCFHCGIQLRGWDPGDIPWVAVEHGRWSPHSRYILNVKGSDFIQEIQEKDKRKEREKDTRLQEGDPIQNIPKARYDRNNHESRQSSKSYSQNNTRDHNIPLADVHALSQTSEVVSLQRNGQSQRQQAAAKDMSSNNKTSNLERKPRCKGMTSQSQPTNPSNVSSRHLNPKSDTQFQKPELRVGSSLFRYPGYEDCDRRLATFCTWSSPVDKTKMAEAGFIYTGDCDFTRCFCCGLGLKNWTRGDDPWVEHVRHGPQCGYILMVKGSSFIQRAQSMLRVKTPPNDLEADALPIYNDNENDLEEDLSDPDEAANSVMPTVQISDSSEPKSKEDVLQNPFRLETAKRVVEEGYLPKDVRLAVLKIVEDDEKDWKSISVADIVAKLTLCGISKTNEQQ